MVYEQDTNAVAVCKLLGMIKREMRKNVVRIFCQIFEPIRPARICLAVTILEKYDRG
jgi:hypothetical protein